MHVSVKLIKIDKILKTGRFRVKEWLSNNILNQKDSKQEKAMKMLEGDSKEKVPRSIKRITT